MAASPPQLSYNAPPHGGYMQLPQEDPDRSKYVRVVHTSEQGLAAHANGPTPAVHNYGPGVHPPGQAPGHAPAHPPGTYAYGLGTPLNSVGSPHHHTALAVNPAAGAFSDTLGSHRCHVGPLFQKESNTRTLSAREAAPAPRNCCQRWLDGEFVIVPEGKFILDMWDCVVIVALFATAFLLPYEVALLSVPPKWWQKLNFCINWIFVIDILVTFNVAYEIRSGSTVDVFERRPLKIAANYMAWPFSDEMRAGWFWPDLFTVLPWEFLIGQAQVFIESHDISISQLLYIQAAEQATGAETESHNNMFQFVRVLKLFRMFRLVRVAKLFTRWHTAVGFSYAAVEVLKCLAVTILTCHWLACAWSYFGIKDDAEHSWLIQIATNPGSHLAEEEDLKTADPIMVYNLALYWATMTLTTVGYGDVIPQSEEEVLIVTVAMIATSFIWAYVLGTVVSIIQNVDVYHTHFSQLMDDLNLLLVKRGVPHSLSRACRRHLHEAYNIQRASHQQSTIRYLSPGLQGKLALQGGQDMVCQCIWYLVDIKEDVLVDIAQVIHGDLFSPNEYIFDRFKVMVLRRGTVAFKGRIYKKDATLGVDMILATDRLRETAGARTLNFVEVMSLHRDALWEVAEKHKDFKKRLRKAQIKLACFRAFVEEGRRRRKKAELEAIGKVLRTQPMEGERKKEDPWVAVLAAVQNLGTEVTDFRKEAMAHMSSLNARIIALDTRMSRLEQSSHKHR